MKIALLVPSWPPGFASNGIVTYAAQLVPALRGLGHEVFVLTSHFMGERRDPYAVANIIKRVSESTSGPSTGSSHHCRALQQYSFAHVDAAAAPAWR
jgi:hypothetical protein